jgi:hypothetical protein
VFFIGINDIFQSDCDGEEGLASAVPGIVARYVCFPRITFYT